MLGSRTALAAVAYTETVVGHLMAIHLISAYRAMEESTWPLPPGSTAGIILDLDRALILFENI